jgi:ring-1,2-phenylacetyl-CoA epoxidase subunit PaaE
MATEFVELRVAGIDRLCEDAVAITFDVPPERADQFRFRAGQSLTLRRGRGREELRRSYSVCAPVGSPPRIGVRAVAGGAVSTWLVDGVRPGDVVEVAPPSGSFTAELDAPAQHVLIGAGSGITPLLSVAATALQAPGSHVLLFYVNRRADSVMFVDELAELKDRYGPRFELVHLLTREQRDIGIATGRLDAARLAELLDAFVAPDPRTQWWLCGPFALVEMAREVIMGRGAAPDHVHRELFYVEDTAPSPAAHVEAAPTGDTATVTITLDGRASTLTLARDVPILDAAQLSRSDLPFACKGGVCGTCRAKVISGEVRMRRNFALEQDELDDGFVLTCQALPVSDEVTIDFDTP